jgi:hypothetical protein
MKVQHRKLEVQHRSRQKPGSTEVHAKGKQFLFFHNTRHKVKKTRKLFAYIIGDSNT